MLAAAMVFSMAAPGYPAYAVNFGDPVKIQVRSPERAGSPAFQLQQRGSPDGAMEGNLFVAEWTGRKSSDQFCQLCRTAHR